MKDETKFLISKTEDLPDGIYFIAKDHTNYQLIPAHRADLIRPDSRAAFHLFMRNARRIFGSHNIGVPETAQPDQLPQRPYLDGNLPALLLR